MYNANNAAIRDLLDNGQKEKNNKKEQLARESGYDAWRRKCEGWESKVHRQGANMLVTDAPSAKGITTFLMICSKTKTKA